ncbi:uncharacterized protein BJ212DRAFT_1479151 [Suillus subaureus]|uniref:Uncharacterized protein n=1 Tax=Suillus subaureus TaxID=48587 RepID=A0A9P7EDZ1_9AGAM|nr:uncharacterized protein BJ212DRAFT_1479151 [Suillus subaureus]KAG1819023.1 hypothetical protein BJ212DRAFT_1479151 [Suillus subaureus]
MPWTKINSGDQPWLNNQETTTLHSHVEDWEKASGTERRQIFKAAAREAKLLAPTMDKELLKQWKEKYKEWFHNHKKCRANAKPSMKLQRKWTVRQVIEEQRKANILQQIWDEVEEETRQKPNQKEVLKRYQPMMMAIMKGLNKKELEEAEAKANEWTNQAPDAAVQAKTAEQKGEKMIKQFATEMFAQAGMRLFVLGSWKDEKGCLMTSGFDFNEQLGKVSSFMKTKDWQVILAGWEDFLGDVFNQDQDLEGTVIRGTHQIPKPYYEFDQDHMGLLILPNMDNVPLETKKSMIWSFLTIHYSKHHIRKMLWKAKGPGAMEQHLEGTIQVGLTFQFKAWIDDKGKMHPPVGAGSDDSDSNANDESVGPRQTRQALAMSTNSQPSSPNHWLSPLVKVPLRKNQGSLMLMIMLAMQKPPLQTQGRPLEWNPPPAQPGQPYKPSASAKTTMLAAQIAEGSDDETPSSVATKAVQDRAPKKTKAVRAASPVLQDWSPKKTRVTWLVANLLSDATARHTRSKANNSLGARPRQKPKRYADYT